MSVRPITKGEEGLAHGQPMTSLLMAFGGLQGLLTHLRLNNMTLRSTNYLATPFAKLTFVPCVLGMACVGHTTGIMFFGDSNLRRLYF